MEREIATVIIDVPPTTPCAAAKCGVPGDHDVVVMLLSGEVFGQQICLGHKMAFERLLRERNAGYVIPAEKVSHWRPTYTTFNATVGSTTNTQAFPFRA